MRATPLLSAFLVATLGTSVPANAGEVCASTVSDKRIANAVKQEVSARHAKVVQSAQHQLRIGVRPGCRGNVTLDVYEVIEAEGFKVVEALAREAQAAVPGAGAVSLRFFEREVWVHRDGGGGHRGKEKLLKSTTVPSPRAAQAREG